MKAYKGFNKDMTCRGYQFKEGEQYHEDNAKLCESGFHACVNPLDCFAYYMPGSSEFHEVELDEIVDEKSNDTKICGKTIKIGAKLDVLGICKAHFEYVREKCIEKINKGDAKQASAGYEGSASAGEYGSASAGYKGSASAGEYGSASAGEYGRSVSGKIASVGKQGCAVVKGNNCRVRGGLGAIILIAEENKDNYDINSWKAAVVDGKIIKADVWYVLKDGEFVEWESEHHEKTNR